MLRSLSSKYQNKNNINRYQAPFVNNSTSVSACFTPPFLLYQYSTLTYIYFFVPYLL